MLQSVVMGKTENTQAREMELPILSAPLNPACHMQKKLKNGLDDKYVFEISVLPWV